MNGAGGNNPVTNYIIDGYYFIFFMGFFLTIVFSIRLESYSFRSKLQNKAYYSYLKSQISTLVFYFFIMLIVNILSFIYFEIGFLELLKLKKSIFEINHLTQFLSLKFKITKSILVILKFNVDLLFFTINFLLYMEAIRFLSEANPSNYWKDFRNMFVPNLIFITFSVYVITINLLLFFHFLDLYKVF